MLEENTGALVTLPAPTVDGAVDGTLDPQLLDQRTVVRVRAYPGMKVNDVIDLFLTPAGGARTLVDKIKVRASQDGAAPFFLVDSNLFAQYLGSLIELNYEISFGIQRLHTSLLLRLEIKAGFEGEQTLDLSSFNYVVIAGKPPQDSPAYSRFTREATWGVAPYEYSSDKATVAVVDPSAEVTAIGNGDCVITATDSAGQSKRYALTVNGIGQLKFITPESSWLNIKEIFKDTELKCPSLAQMRQLLKIYDNHAGALTDYLGCLPYPFWTADLNGANTAWIVDLDKPVGNPLDPNPTSADLSELHQLLGVSMS